MTQAEMATEQSEDDILRNFFIQNVQQNPNIQVSRLNCPIKKTSRKNGFPEKADSLKMDSFSDFDIGDGDDYKSN